MGRSRITDKGRFRQKRGTGRFKNYRPWLRVLEVPSCGRSHRIYCKKTQRHHELLSDMEEYFFWICVWNEEIIDIREQFPLLSKLKTQSIATKFGFVHPRIPIRNKDIVMTTDFVITKVIDGKMVDIARSVKTKSDLNKLRTREKLAIERQYWNTKGIDWALITEDSFPIFLAKNIKLISDIDDWVNIMGIKESHINELHRRLMKEECQFIDTVFISSELDAQFGFEQGNFLNIVKYLIWTKRIRVDMESDMLDFKRIKILER